MSPEWAEYLQRMHKEDEAEQKKLMLTPDEWLLTRSGPEQPEQAEREGYPATGPEGQAIQDSAERPDDRPVVWELANRKHIQEDHSERQVTVEEVDQVLSDPERRERFNRRRDAYETLGQAQNGRWFVVAWVEDARGRYPVHAREAGRRTLRRWAT